VRWVVGWRWPGDALLLLTALAIASGHLELGVGPVLEVRGRMQQTTRG